MRGNGGQNGTARLSWRESAQRALFLITEDLAGCYVVRQAGVRCSDAGGSDADKRQGGYCPQIALAEVPELVGWIDAQGLHRR